jgi:hypothetical protein
VAWIDSQATARTRADTTSPDHRALADQCRDRAVMLIRSSLETDFDGRRQ